MGYPELKSANSGDTAGTRSSRRDLDPAGAFILVAPGLFWKSVLPSNEFF